MPANGKYADDGRVQDLAVTVRQELGRKADDAEVVKQIQAADGTPLPMAGGVVTLPASSSGAAVSDTDYSALITN